MSTKLPRLIGLSGKARSGKGTVAEYITNKYKDVLVMSFAYALKKICMTAFGFTANQVYGEEKLVVDPYWGNTPAYFLQKVGTEGFREVIDEDFWCKSLMRRVDKVLEEIEVLVVIDDVRFPNEAKTVIDRGGILIRIEREGLPPTGRDNKHHSETALDDYPFEHVIHNNGTLEDLYREVDNILQKYN